MKLKNYILLGVLIVIKFSIKAQTHSFDVPLNFFVEDEKGKKMQSIVAVFKYKGQPLEDPINFGVDTKKESKKFFAKLPDMQGVKDTNYAYIYFGALNERKDLSGYALAIIGNNKRKANQPALIWIDRNYNLDLTDDGAPDTFSNNLNNLDIVLTNPKNSSANYTVNISRFDFKTNPKYIGLLDDYYKENQGNKEFAGTLFSFRELRINCIGGDYKYELDSFRVAIKDANCNGFYNDENTDFVFIGDYKTPELPDNKILITSKKNQFYFERKGVRYNIKHIDPLGRFITIEVDKNAEVKNALKVGKKLKKFKFHTTDKQRKLVSIKKFKKKPTYIYVWRFDQKDFDKDTAILRKIATEYGSVINIVTLNYGENPKELSSFKRRTKVNWLVGQSTIKINKKLFIEEFPTGILTSKKLRVKRIRISPSELLVLLQNNQI